MPPDNVNSPDTFVNEAFARYRLPLISYAQRFLRDGDRARDVVQEVFIRMCRHFDVKESASPLGPWLFKVCRRLLIDIHRKENRMQSVDFHYFDEEASSDPDPQSAAETSDDLRHIFHLLKKLSPNQQEVLRLKFQNSFSYREISEITELSESNVGFLIHTGLTRLREEIARSTPTTNRRMSS